jgi:TPR repeat protein
MRETLNNPSKPSARRIWLIFSLVIVVAIAGYFVLRAKHEVPASEASVGTEVFGDRKVVDNSSIISFPEVVRRAKAGDPKWQLALGDAYFEGNLQLKDDTEAIKWIKLASDAGYVPAHVRLGYIYDHVPGTLRDEKLAFSYYYKAAMSGHAESQYEIASRFHEGKGVAVNNVAAYAWANLSAANSNHSAAVYRDAVVGRGMLPAQIDEAQKLSRQLLAEIEANLAKK